MKPADHGETAMRKRLQKKKMAFFGRARPEALPSGCKRGCLLLADSLFR
jgi:hypothetical protein